MNPDTTPDNIYPTMPRKPDADSIIPENSGAISKEAVNPPETIPPKLMPKMRRNIIANA
jgi:hypothetical protein